MRLSTKLKLRQQFLPWSHTFWFTWAGRLLAPLFNKSLICGQTCGCCKATGCGSSDLPKETRWLSWGTRRNYWRRPRAR